MLTSNSGPSEIMKKEKLMIIEDDSFINDAIKDIFNKNSNEFDRLKNGEMKLVGFFMGQAMRELKGKADPKTIQKIINKYLKN